VKFHVRKPTSVPVGVNNPDHNGCDSHTNLSLGLLSRRLGFCSGVVVSILAPSPPGKFIEQSSKKSSGRKRSRHRAGRGLGFVINHRIKQQQMVPGAGARNGKRKAEHQRQDSASKKAMEEYYRQALLAGNDPGARGGRSRSGDNNSGEEATDDESEFSSVDGRISPGGWGAGFAVAGGGGGGGEEEEEAEEEAEEQGWEDTFTCRGRTGSQEQLA